MVSVCSSTVETRRYPVSVGRQHVELPVVTLNEDLALALLITVDMGVRFMSQAGEELAEILRPFDVDIVATVATMGIPLAVEVTRHLGLDQYVILHKTPKIHLADAVSEPVRSITTNADQRLLFDRARVPDVEGKRVAIVDDVISTGASTGAALRLLRRVGADVAVIGTLVTEASLWKEALGEDTAMVHALGSIPVFRPDRSGAFIEDWVG
ncbi:MAG: adenine phosphoribosyltransferase [Acidobacteriota bacterium]|nr:adenine phosphoribosyltransferase [Acidobacteriota bacterium]MDE3044308.1 adenine phosphoribosyltransferase [Acidobacteriota bacterium]MDE3107011.1 adenine phosphoribosyltransferase [Acidobacteriota bacterium]MDE3222008.1 adenine phosphoribosyltransferase [Acidobacteriota bacterium]